VLYVRLKCPPSPPTAGIAPRPAQPAFSWRQGAAYVVVVAAAAAAAAAAANDVITTLAQFGKGARGDARAMRTRACSMAPLCPRLPRFRSVPPHSATERLPPFFRLSYRHSAAFCRSAVVLPLVSAVPPCSAVLPRFCRDSTRFLAPFCPSTGHAAGKGAGRDGGGGAAPRYAVGPPAPPTAAAPGPRRPQHPAIFLFLELTVGLAVERTCRRPRSRHTRGLRARRARRAPDRRGSMAAGRRRYSQRARTVRLLKKRRARGPFTAAAGC